MKDFATRHRAGLVAFGCIALVAAAIGTAAFVLGDSPDRSVAGSAAVAPIAVDPGINASPGSGAPSYPGPPRLTGPLSPGPPPSMPYPGPSSLPLPPPGPEQPADPVSARQAVTDLIARAWTPDATDAQRFENFDDSHGFDQVMHDLRNGPVAAQANSAVSAKVDEVVFVTPTRADIEFTFTIANYGSVPGFFGIANLRNGEWKLTRSTFCNALPTTGAKCPA